MPTRFHLVVFDLGRVMIRLCSGWQDACRRAGVPWRDEIAAPEMQRRLINHMIEHETGRIDDNIWATRTANEAGITPAQALAISHHWLAEPCPGFHALLDRLDDANIRTACLSNTNALHWRLMSEGDGPTRLPLDRLTFRFASHLIGAMKPDASVYRHVEKTTGVPPRAIVFFDDAVPNVEGARARGWSAQHIDPAGDPASQIAEALHGYGILE